MILQIGQQIRYFDAEPGRGNLTFLGSFHRTEAMLRIDILTQHLFALPTGKNGNNLSLVVKLHDQLVTDLRQGRVVLTDMWASWKSTVSSRVEVSVDASEGSETKANAEESLFSTWERKPNKIWKEVQKCRSEALAPILPKIDELLGRDNPQAALNAELRGHGLNATRYRTLLFAYLASGRNPNAFYPDFVNCGAPGKERFSVVARLGRPVSRRANGERSRATVNMSKEMRERIIESYSAHRAVGRTMGEIRLRALATHFSYRIVGEGSGVKVIKDDSLGEPTLEQYDYHVRKYLSSPRLQRHRLGEKDYGQRKQPRPHKFSDSLVYAGQRLEADGSGAKRPVVSALDPRRQLRPMTTARIVCATSGMIWGAGFSLTGEGADIYRMALFSMGMEKVAFCAQWGIKIEPEEWPVAGFGRGIHTDRGAGMQDALFPTYEKLFGRAQFVQGGRGDRKPMVETVQDKKKRRYGKIVPTVPLTAFQIVRATLYDILTWNAVGNVSDRLTPDMIRDRVEPTPIGIHNYLAARGRAFVKTFPVEYLVKEFLHKGRGAMHEDGVHFLGQRYMSEELLASGYLHRAKRGAFDVPLYYLNLAPRHVYLPEGDRLYKLNMCLIQDDDAVLEHSEDDLEVKREALAANRRDHAPKRDAAALRNIVKRDSDEANAKARYRAAVRDEV